MAYTTGRVLPDSSDFGIWTLNEAATPYPCIGVGGDTTGAPAMSPGAAGVTVNQNGKLDKACQFAGGNVHSYLYTPDLSGLPFEPTGSFTVSAWVRLTAFTVYGGLLAKNYRTGLNFSAPWTPVNIEQSGSADGKLDFNLVVGAGVLVGGTSSVALLSLNTWCHIGLVYNRSTNYLYCYCNGAQVYSLSESRAIDWGDHGGWFVGGLPGATPYSSAGLIDDVRLANVARAGTWFSQVWASGPPSFTKDRLNEQNAGISDVLSTLRTLAGTGSSQQYDQPQLKPGVVIDGRTGISRGDENVPASGAEGGGVGDSQTFRTTGGSRTPPLPPTLPIGLTADITPEDAVPTETAGGIGDAQTFRTLGTTGLRTPPLPPTLPIGLAADSFPEKYIPTEMQAGIGDEGSLAVLDQTPDYSPLKLDADSRAFLGDHAVQAALLYDATADTWHTPDTDFCGYGRDGNSYINGQACLQGGFGTLTTGFNKRSWACAGNPPMDCWLGSGFTQTMYADDKVQNSYSSTPSGGSAYMMSFTRWVMPGDFDVQVEFEAFTHSGGGDGGFFFGAYIDGRNGTYARRQVGGVWDKDVMNNGSWGSYSSVGGAGTSGKLRITRVGKVVSSFYWNGVSWSQIGSSVTMTNNGAMGIFVGSNCTNSGCSGGVRFFAFTVNSGTISYQAGWAREAAGTHRGSRADFPTHALIVATMAAIDIIDLDSDKLWMRFVKSGSNALQSFGYRERIWNLAMKDGVLAAAYGDHPDDSEEGASIIIDFNLDTIRLMRKQASGWTGAYYLDPLSSNDDNMSGALGAISGRNSGVNYGSDFDSWRQLCYRTHSVDVALSGGYLFRASAGSPGVTVHKWQRWYNYGTAPASYNTPYWCFQTLQTTNFHWVHFDQSTLMLYYMDASNLYSSARATWEGAMNGGTFVADSTVALPTSSPPQGLHALRRPIMIGSVLYIAATEGIYSLTWPTPPWVLTFGGPDSGATYPILPQGRVLGHALRTDSGTNYLLVTTKHLRYGRILTVINLTTNAVYDRFVLPYESMEAAA